MTSTVFDVHSVVREVTWLELLQVSLGLAGLNLHAVLLKRARMIQGVANNLIVRECHSKLLQPLSKLLHDT